MILCCWYFGTGSYPDVDRQVNVQVWDNFLALATSAIMCATTDQSAETFLDSPQHYVLKCQTGTAVDSPKGTKFWLSLYDSVDSPSLDRQSGHRAYQILASLLTGFAASRDSCRECICLGVPQ